MKQWLRSHDAIPKKAKINFLWATIRSLFIKERRVFFIVGSLGAANISISLLPEIC